jgi:hypothetical protein
MFQKKEETEKQKISYQQLKEIRDKSNKSYCILLKGDLKTRLGKQRLRKKKEQI